MWNKKEKKALFRWSVLFALVHLVLIVCFYGLDVPKSIVTIPLDHKNGTPLFAVTRWIDPLAWPIFGAFFLFVFLPIKRWTDDKMGPCPAEDPCLHDVNIMGVIAFCISSGVTFLIIGLLLSISKGLISGLLNGALVSLSTAAGVALFIWALFFVVWACIKTVPVLQRFRTDNSFVESCVKPLEKLLNFLNAEE